MKSKPKSFFIISAFQIDSTEMAHLRKLDSEADAIERAKDVIARRQRHGNRTLSFYVMKCVAVVEPETAPVKVRFFK